MEISRLVYQGMALRSRETTLTGRYALVSEQGKGQPKYVRMRGQTVEEVVIKSEYTSAVSS